METNADDNTIVIMLNQYHSKEPRDYAVEWGKKDFKKRPVREVVCEYCGKHICYAAEYDLEGTKFACDDCFAKIKE